MKDKGFRFEDHTADIQVKAWAPTLEEVYEESAYSLMTTISPDLNKIFECKKKTIHINSEDQEALLFDFLSELLYIFDVKKLIFSNINITKIWKEENIYHLKADLIGEEFSRNKHAIGTEVKAITYSYMHIKKVDDLYEIQVIFDI